MFRALRCILQNIENKIGKLSFTAVIEQFSQVVKSVAGVEKSYPLFGSNEQSYIVMK